MKRISLIFLTLLMVFALLSGCAAKTQAAYDLNALSSQLSDSGAFSDIISPVEADIAVQLYGISSGDVAESVVLCSTGATTEEIGLFKCSGEDAAAKVYEAAKKRVETQRDTYQSYAPGEMPKLDDAIVKQSGVYVFYVVSNDYTKAQAVLDAAVQ